MENTDTETLLIEGYLQLLDNLSPTGKLALIARLSASMKSDLANKESSFQKAFGAFDSEMSAEEIIEDIRSSRTFTRKIEGF